MTAKEETMHVNLSQLRSFLKTYKAKIKLRNGDTKKRKRKKETNISCDLASKHLRAPISYIF